MTHKISKKNDEIYSDLFGKDAKGENVVIDNKNNVNLDEMNQPFMLRISNQFFKIVDMIFTTVVPCFVILMQVFVNTGFTEDYSYVNIFKFVFESNFIISLLVVIGYIVAVKLVIWIVNFLINFIIIAIYSTILNKIVKQSEKVSKAITEKLSKMDKQDKEKEERKKYNGFTEKEVVDHAKELIKKRQEEVKSEEQKPDIELIKRDI